jgi:hypothetical protein
MENAAKGERDAGRNQAKSARMKLDKENAAAKMELELKELNKLIQVLKLSESEMNELRQAVDTLQTAQEGAKNVGRLDEHKKRIFRYQ